jgi:hypothetical protein
MRMLPVTMNTLRSDLAAAVEPVEREDLGHVDRRWPNRIMMFWRMNDTPMAVMSGASQGACRRAGRRSAR